MKTILTIILLSLLSPYSYAAYERSEQLLWACNSEMKTPQEALDRMHCVGYVSGIFEGVQLVFNVKPETRFICSPEGGVSTDQQIKIITKYLDENPQDLHKSSRVTVLIALMKAFPCK